jgi:hypothetical protein
MGSLMFKITICILSAIALSSGWILITHDEGEKVMALSTYKTIAICHFGSLVCIFATLVSYFAPATDVNERNNENL